MNLKQLLELRYSAKKFQEGIKIEDNTLLNLLEMTNLSASSMGLQPFKMVVISDKDLLSRLTEYSFHQENVRTCSHLVLFAARTDIDADFVENYIRLVAEERQTDKANLASYAEMLHSFVGGKDEEALFRWASEQIYIALGTFLVACAREQVDACPIGGFMSQKYDELLSLPARNLRSVVAGVIGKGDEDDKYKYLKKVRQPLEEMIVRIG